MKIMFIGLGLIGGSMALALEGYPELERYAVDGDEPTRLEALGRGVVRAAWTNSDDAPIEDMDVVVLCLHPEAAADFIRRQAGRIKPDALLTDVCGVKRPLREAVGEMENRKFIYLGGHPMAGSHFSGFKYSHATMFCGAPMVLVPPRFDDMALLQWVKDALSPCHFGSFSVTTAADHDRMIAFTSQMPHILSNGYIKSPTAQHHKGFSAGSYKDLTRVAWLNAPMWAELFLENRENVLFELDTYLENLKAYRDAIASGDRDMLVALLDAGKRCKEEVDG